MKDSAADQRVREWLSKQRDALINMSRSNKLLNFKHTKVSSLELSAPEASQILDRLNNASAAGNYWEFHFPVSDDSDEVDQDSGEERAATELEVSGKESPDIRKSLYSLERKANQEFVDKGIWVLYLGLGILTWYESENDDKPYQSPLVLVPVMVSRDRSTESYWLRRADGDNVINPALHVKLSNEFGIELPSLDLFESEGLNALLQEIRKQVRKKSNWSVQYRAVLSTFSFAKEVMYRDLVDNESTLTADPAVQLLALGPDAPAVSEFTFEPVSDADLDRVAPPEGTVTVRDADATQRACIQAARNGQSFVMDGPPGSGKSQTITNMIAELLYAGKSVLFVSEKAAALEVVQNRLIEVGLDQFALQLHSHKATRQAVAGELTEALTQKPSARSRIEGYNRDKLSNRRKELSTYAQAMNEIRHPLGYSLHHVLGLLALLRLEARPPLLSTITNALSGDELETIRDDADALGRNWGPVDRGDDFVWRDLVEASHSPAKQNEIQRGLDTGLARLDELRQRVEAFDAVLGLGWQDGPLDGRRWSALLEVLDRRHDIPAVWLQRADLQAVSERCVELAETTGEYWQQREQLHAVNGDRADELDTDLLSGVRASRATLAQQQPAFPVEDHDQQQTLDARVDFATRAVPTLDALHKDARWVAETFGLPGDGIGLTRARELGELAQRSNTIDRPEPEWFDRTKQAALDEAVQVLRVLLDEFREKRDELHEIYTADVLELDLPRLRARFTTVHKGFRKLGSAYRADKRTLAACTMAGRADRNARQQLGEAVRWQQLSEKLAAAEEQHAGILGERYYRRADADFEQIVTAIDNARSALKLAGDQPVGADFARQLAAGGDPDPMLPQVGERLVAGIDSFRDDAYRTLGAVIERFPELLLEELAEWCRTVADGLGVLSTGVSHVSDIVGHSVSLATADCALADATRVRELATAVDADRDADSVLFGARFDGVHTDWADLRGAITWTRELREMLAKPVAVPVAEMLLRTEYTQSDISAIVTQWDSATAMLVDQFTGAQANHVAQFLTEDFVAARNMLEHLRDTLSDTVEWYAFIRARQSLTDQGLNAAVTHCIEQQVAANEVASVIECAVLEAWVEDIMRSDSDRLGAVRADERDTIVEEFRELDARQAADAASRVINACAQRRPESEAGQAGVIRHEGQKVRKHMPIRTLLDKAGSVAQQLKPCFMMSPLSISQYLPASLRFDVVIFDEASQVLPCDAINSVYRADQFIVAGDENQLPPTAFFSAGVGSQDDTYDESQIDDFESVLDLAKANGVTSLPLRWHYRSQHESLITYSNYAFYHGRLQTFPGAVEHAPDLGIELFPVNGIYRRGSTRNNPVEAEKVVERVLFHRRNHPDNTIGVVTFSAAQEDTIEAELYRQSADHPELAQLNDEDRLAGFFVKNLENVQGDERDIIVFSIGYGPDEYGKFATNIPHLRQEKSERRLNVAVTRAKRRVEIVSSVTADDFPSTPQRGAMAHLPRYLDFAERGIAALATDPQQDGGEVESPFEEEVLNVVRTQGYEAIPQVGAAGYRIDIGVKHPDRQGTYVLGIECDGAMYHSAKTARDRDRLRQHVLEGLGWRIHRIWGPAWYRDRAGQETRLRTVIEEAVMNGVRKHVPPDDPAELVTVKHAEVDLDAPPTWAVSYSPARPKRVKTTREIHEPEARQQLHQLVEKLVHHEEPVHEERVFNTVWRAWGYGRSGKKIRKAFEDAVRELEGTTLQRDTARFLWVNPSRWEAVRVPTAGDKDTKRKVERVPVEELRLAVLRFVSDCRSVSRQETVSRLAKLFGWQSTTPNVEVELTTTIDQLVSEGAVRQHEEHLVAVG